MNKLHALFLWMIFPGVIFAWFLTIFTFYIAEFIITMMWPMFHCDMLQYIDGAKRKWREK